MQPALATSWSTSDDKLTWTFKLRQGVRFHDGTPFNAAAVKATFDRIRDPATASPRRSALAAITDDQRRRRPHDRARHQGAVRAAAGADQRLQPRDHEPGAGAEGRRALSRAAGRHRAVQAEELAAGRAHHARAQRRLLGREGEARRAGNARGAGGFRARAAAAQRRGGRHRLGADRDAQAARSVVRREGDQEDRLPHHLCRPEQFAAAVQRPPRARGGGACDRRQRAAARRAERRRQARRRLRVAGDRRRQGDRAARLTIPRRRASCWPRRAIRTASRPRSTCRPAAT